MKKLNNYIFCLFLIFSIVLFSVPFWSRFQVLEVVKNAFAGREKLRVYLIDIKDDDNLERKIVFFATTFHREESDSALILGDYFKRKGNFEKAIYFYERAVRFNPLGTITAYQELAELYKNMGKEREREDLISNFAGLIIEKQSKYPDLGYELRKPASELIYSLAEEKFKKGNYDKALESLEMAIKMDPWVICHLTPLSLLDVDSDISKPFIDKLLKLDSKYFLCFYEYYIKLFYSAGFLEKVTGIAPEWSPFWIELGNSYLKKGEFEKAESAFKSCLEYTPEASDCKRALEWLENRQNGMFP